MVFVYPGKFETWTEDNQRVIDQATRGSMKVIVLQVETPESDTLSEQLKTVANLPNVYFSATEQNLEEALKSPFMIENKNIFPEYLITGMHKGQIVYKFLNIKDPNLKDYDCWFKAKEFTGQIHRTDMDEPMADYGFSNNITTNGTKGFMNWQQGIVELENGENKIYLTTSDLHFLAMESSFFEKQIEIQTYPQSFCCNTMESHLKQGECEQHGADCPDKAFSFKNGKWTLHAANASYVMYHCPWCGTKLELNPDEEEQYKTSNKS